MTTRLTRFNHARRFLSTTPVDPSTIKWSELGFGYVPTRGTVLIDNNSGTWDSSFRVSEEPFVKLHVLSNVLHYGQALFEGLKAFERKDGSIAAFNPKENARRMNIGAQRLAMPPLDESTFLKGIEEVIKLNKDYVPPYGTGGSFYLRPFYFGHGAKLGLGAASSYTFGVIGSPVGLYYPTGLKAVDALVVENYDRAAPRGVGAVKTAGNYAADILPAAESAKKGFTISLYLDAKEHKYVEEFSTSNFIAVTKDGKKYVTPKSDSILKSTTNIVLRQLAKKNGLEVEERRVSIDELKSGDYSEVAACGTAVIVTPIKSITHKGEKIKFNEKIPVLEKLYTQIRKIQTGEMEDEFGWCQEICKR